MASKRSGDDELQENDKKSKGGSASEDAVVVMLVAPGLIFHTVGEIVAFTQSPEVDLSRAVNTEKAWVLRGILGASFHGANVRNSVVRLFFIDTLHCCHCRMLGCVTNRTNYKSNVFKSGCRVPGFKYRGPPFRT